MEPSYYATLHRVQERHWWYAARRTILKGVLEELHDRGLPPGSLYDLGCGVGANLLGRVRKRPGAETAEVPSPAVNLALRSVFAAEAPLVRKLHLPFGVSLLCVARKPAA